jgi:hypothetical protein
VPPPGQFALGELRYPALRKYRPFLAATVRAAGMTWTRDPQRGLLAKSPFANNQKPWVLRARCPLKRRAPKQRDDPEALGVIIHLPTATATTHENRNPGVRTPASDSQTR